LDEEDGISMTQTRGTTPHFRIRDEPAQGFETRLRRLQDGEQTRIGLADGRRLEADMRRGLITGQFRVHYQPIVTLPLGEIVSVEALVRWEHPDRGLVPPMDFIPAAEQSGLIVDLGEWVLNEACRQVVTWQQSVPELRRLRVAVNVSAHQLTGHLCDVVARALATSGLPADCLELEITESVVMADIDDALEILDQLGTLGVSLSIDDFGTGFSSLAYLKRLPVTGLKIDKSFIDDLSEDSRDLSIVGAVIAMASALGLTQIAEGVETEEQRQLLEGLGCAHAQGYLFSRPLPAEIFLEQVTPLLAAAERDLEPMGDAPLRVLVCDDELSIRKLYRRALRSCNVVVFDAVDAQDCLVQTEDARPDLVILDMRLPDRSGIDILGEVRALRPTARVVVVSGLVTPQMVEAARANGAVACVPKMQLLPQLGALVEECRH
jgi:EAL domain-containing protein (putative c-di-GMP-specific phosphodiesterase class I)